LTVFGLKVQQLRYARPREDAVASPPADLSETQRDDEADQIVEGDVANIAAPYPVEQACRPHPGTVRTRYDSDSGVAAAGRRR